MIKQWCKFIVVYLTVSVLGTAVMVLATYVLHPGDVSRNVPAIGKAFRAAPFLDDLGYRVRDRLARDAAQRRAMLTPRPSANRSPSSSQPDPSQVPVSGPSGSRFLDGQENWGVVNSPSTRVYSNSGKFLFRASSGALTEIAKILKTPSGEFAYCHLHLGNKDFEHVLIRTDDLAIRPGPLAKADEEQRRLLVQLSEITQKIEDRQTLLIEQARNKNPHAREYFAVKSSYQTFWKNVKALQAKRDKATGSDHVRFSEELRKLKGDDIRLGQSYEAAKKDFDAWNARHASVPEDDGLLISLRKELSAAEDDLMQRERSL